MSSARSASSRGRHRRHDAGLLRRHFAVEGLGAHQALFRGHRFQGRRTGGGEREPRAARAHGVPGACARSTDAAPVSNRSRNRSCGNVSRFFSADLAYDAEFGAGQGLRPHIRVEMSFRGAGAAAHVARPIRSLIATAQRQPPEVAAFPCVDPVETAADKLSALAWRVRVRDRARANDDPTIIRHLHDLAALEQPRPRRRALLSS